MARVRDRLWTDRSRVPSTSEAWVLEVLNCGTGPASKTESPLEGEQHAHASLTHVVYLLGNLSAHIRLAFSTGGLLPVSEIC